MKPLIIATVLLVAGCGTNVGIGTVTPEQAARQTCRQEGFTENEINSFFIAVEIDRDDGFTKSVEVNMILSLGSVSLSNCMFAIIDAVYP